MDTAPVHLSSTATGSSVPPPSLAASTSPVNESSLRVGVITLACVIAVLVSTLFSAIIWFWLRRRARSKTAITPFGVADAVLNGAERNRGALPEYVSVAVGLNQPTGYTGNVSQTHLNSFLPAGTNDSKRLVARLFSTPNNIAPHPPQP